MQKYIHKPTIIEAMQLTRLFATAAVRWVGEAKLESYGLGEFPEEKCFLEIKTFHGMMIANENDYIIKMASGGVYPCSEKTFNDFYEKSGEDNNANN